MTGLVIRLGLLEPDEVIHNDSIYPIADVNPSVSGVEFGTYIVNLYNLDANQKIFSALPATSALGLVLADGGEWGRP